MDASLFGIVVLWIGAVIVSLRRARYAEGTIVPWRIEICHHALAAAKVKDVHREGGVLVGRSGALEVRISQSGDHAVLRVTIAGDSGLTLRAESLATELEKKLGAREMTIGDEAFDREVYVLGASEIAYAVLDATTRQLVRDMLARRIRVGARGTAPLDADVSVRDGDLVAVFSPGMDDDAMRSELSYGLVGLLDVARRLARPRNPLQRIVANLAAEPRWEVRLAQVELLAHKAHAGFVREALKAACLDPSVDVRVRAAIALGDEGHATLIEVVSADEIFDAAAARAVDALGDALPIERVSAILSNALRKRFTDTAHACIAALGARGGPSAVDQLAAALALETSPLAVSAARGLGATGAAAAEEPLVRALVNDDTAIAVAAAEALGAVGSAHAVPALKDAAAASSSELRRAARHAIVAIRSRLTGATPGQLSIADGAGGALSVADVDPAGRVSMAGAGPSGVGVGDE